MRASSDARTLPRFEHERLAWALALAYLVIVALAAVPFVQAVQRDEVERGYGLVPLLLATAPLSLLTLIGVPENLVALTIALTATALAQAWFVWRVSRGQSRVNEGEQGGTTWGPPDGTALAEGAGRRTPTERPRGVRFIAFLAASWTLYQSVYWFQVAMGESQGAQDGSFALAGYGVAALFAIATLPCLWFAMRTRHS